MNNDYRIFQKNFTILGLSIVKQAFISYKSDLLFLKKNKKELITAGKVKFYKRHKMQRAYMIFKDIIEINDFIQDEWYTLLCPVRDTIAKQKLEELEQKVLKEKLCIDDLKRERKILKKLIKWRKMIFRKKEGGKHERKR